MNISIKWLNKIVIELSGQEELGDIVPNNYKIATKYLALEPLNVSAVWDLWTDLHRSETENPQQCQEAKLEVSAACDPSHWDSLTKAQ